MGIHHPFGPSRGARGENHIGQVRARRPLRNGRIVQTNWLLDKQGRKGGPRQLPGRRHSAVFNNQDTRGAIIEHLHYSILRRLGIQRHVGGARLENPEQADRQLP
ncbi:UDP-N-acetylmuramyl pentapeptide synthase [Pseudomonas syringae pv. actinidiae]|uniref:UDP-N-acetylmuramyl pentapeptide synthase n=1 Tax=Pseudomonas syringae pv. actinidiae TaxID=103796 RepID=A0AAN4TJ52_PSESF|nr:UDP-N-acetylmuramyl pentapeptide synthase [Pseudomonas syringae pv. actinidiae]